MPRLRLLAVALDAVLAAALVLTPGVAAAHNTLVSSDPADGAVLSVAPSQITWRFDKSVPLETMSVTLIDATGARSELSGSTHGAAGDTEVVTLLAWDEGRSVELRVTVFDATGQVIDALTETRTMDSTRCACGVLFYGWKNGRLHRLN